jgi:1-deoxy-D-xylulose-5-phosphate synthase
MDLLNNLDLPKDLKKLSTKELETLAQEIRTKVIDVCKKCGGHLASNLGVLELTIALHTVLNSPQDKIVWDVSHQCYTHKILTGRLNEMDSLRQYKGISGFTKMSESDHDVFGAGHASTALSAALGIAHARDIKGEKFAVCAVIGDGSFSGGMVYEALNNAARLKTNLICILNDNDMAISKPVGGMAKYITQIRTSNVYTSAKQKFEGVFDRIPKIGVPLKKKIEKTVDRLRDLVVEVREGVIFEEFGFRYLGPINGHNIPLLMGALKYAKNYDKPVMIHVITKKGKGHLPAERNPIYYHGISPKNSNKVQTEKRPTFTEIFGDEIVQIALKNENVVVVTPAMAEGSGLQNYANTFPKRFFDVGIAEEHAVTFCAGLAANGLKPVLAIYSTFLQRGFDQVIHDVCLQNLPVVFALDRAGLVGEDGPTHHGVFDLSYLLLIPNLVILAPKDEASLRQMLQWSIKQEVPVAIRYPRGEVCSSDLPNKELEAYKAEVMLDFEKHSEKDKKILLIAVGNMSMPAYNAAQKLQEEKGLDCAAIDLGFVKPFDKDLVKKYAGLADHVLLVEEGSAIGGVFFYVLRELMQENIDINKWQQIAVPDEFIEHGCSSILREKYGLCEEGIIKRVRNLLENSK